MMKAFGFVLLVSLLPAFGGDLSSCKYYSILKDRGWKIHASKNFQRVAEERLAYLEEGLEEGSLAFDMEGLFLNRNGVNSSQLYLKVMAWDDLRTPREEMFGDLAVMRDAFGQNEVVEIRWYERGVRNLVVNPKRVYCMVESFPFAENSIL